MWFAALGTYQHNPWLINFISKLLDGCEAVTQLLDEPELTEGDDTLLAIRANLYSYDFTRMDTEWNRKIPGITLLSEQNRQDQWWSRHFSREYLPAIEAGNVSLQNFLSNYGFTSMCHYQDGDKCNRLSDNILVGRKMCAFCSFCRQHHFVWTPILSALFLLLLKRIK